MLIIYIVQSALLQFIQELTGASHSHKNNVCKLAAARIIVMMIHPGIKFPSDVVFRRSMTSGRFITMGFLCSGYGLIITDTQHRASWLLLSAGVSQHRLVPGAWCLGLTHQDSECGKMPVLMILHFTCAFDCSACTI